MTTTRLGPRQAQMLETMRRATDAGVTLPKVKLIDQSAPKRTQEGQREIVNGLIRRGLLRDLNSPAEPDSYFGGWAAALVITDFGREILAARAART